MAIALKKRRVVAVANESTRGTLQSINPTIDAVPTIRELTVTPSPVSIERPTLRLSLTTLPDTYPGVATAEVKFVCELGGLPTNPQTTYAVPVWFDLFRACGFQERSGPNPGPGGGAPRLLHNVTNLTGGTAGSALRHGETVTGNGGTIAGTGVVMGDFFFEDDVLCVRETTAPTGTALTTWTGGTSSRVATGTRGTNVVAALELQSDVNLSECVSIEAYHDGKRWRIKGCMGEVSLLLDYGDMIRAEFTMQGVVNAYADVAMPATPNEAHKIAPTFLGKEVRFYEISSTATGYGRDAAGFVNVSGSPTVNGSLTQVRLNTGNNVILRQNALDPSGISFAVITARAPTGTVNPDEVLNTEFDWISKLQAGSPMRFKAMIGTPGTSLQAAQDGNTIDLLCPGIVLNQMGDGDRDGVQAWDGAFKITGGDYDPSAAGETPGNDNEFTLIYR